MKSKVYPFLTLAFLITLLLSACGPAPAASWPGITLGKDNAYLSYSQVFVVRPSDGSLLGKYPEKTEGAGMFASPALSNDLLVVGDYSNNLHGVNLNTLTLLWKFTDAKARFIAPALITDKLVLAPNADGFLYAIDPASGKELWKFSANSPLWSQPLYYGKLVYQGTLDHFLFALDPTQNGSPAWKVDLGGAIVSTPLLDSKGILYVGTLAKELLAVDSATQKILWRNNEFSDGIWSTPVIKDQTLFVSSQNGMVYAVDSAQGKILWKTDLGGAVTGSGAATPNGIVFITEKGDVVMLGYEKGDVVWKTATTFTLYGSPVSTTDRILVGATHSSDTLMISYDFTGKQLWTLPVPK